MTIKRSYKILTITLLVFYLLYLIVANLPAKYAASFAHKAMPTLWLNSVSGTAWNGVAHQAQVDINKKPVALGKVQWRLLAPSLFVLKACFEISAIAPGQTFEGVACKGFSDTVELQQSEFNFPASLFGNALGAAVTGQLSGQIQKLEVSVKQNAPYFNTLNAKVSWQNITANVESKWYSLGSMAADMTHTKEGAVGFDLFSLDGPYGVEAKGSWSPVRSWAVEATIEGKQEADPQVMSSIKFFATEELPGNKFYIKWP